MSRVSGSQVFLLATTGLAPPLLVDVEAISGDPDLFVATSEATLGSALWLATSQEVGSEHLTLPAAIFKPYPLLWARVAPATTGSAISYRVRVRTQAAAVVTCIDSCKSAANPRRLGGMAGYAGQS